MDEVVVAMPSPLDRLYPHPDNPRLEPRQEVVDAIAADIAATGKFDPAHALIVRPFGDGWQIISGHHRALAARQAGLTTVPAWVRDLDDAAAYMLLLKANTQSELTPVERGRHAIKSGLDVKAYAASVGRPQRTVANEVWAAEVTSEAVADIGNGAAYFSRLVEIHAAPRWLWPALVAALVADGWSVEQTRRKVAEMPKRDAPPPYLDVAGGVVAGLVTAANIAQVARAEKDKADEIAHIRRQLEDAGAALPEAAPNPPRPFTSCADALDYLDQTFAPWRRALDTAKKAEGEKLRAREEVQARTARLRNYCSLPEWKALDAETRAALLACDADATGFNKQDNKSIEWAQWSWNPITGCEHDCPYCYARDIAEGSDRASAFPNGFTPTLRPRAIRAPRGMKVPDAALVDTRLRNVFLGSMADVFGRWVPAEWIEAIFAECRAAPDWNFLCLTKFPKRMAEFDVPENVWMGATVDLQARVKATEDGFANVKSKVRWLSCEPMLEPLVFEHLDRFDWLVIGGASRSSKTPKWAPPYAWIRDLEAQADAAGVKVYHKSNLFDENARRLELPFDAPIEGDAMEAPAVFHYLKRQIPAGEQAARASGRSAEGQHDGGGGCGTEP